MSVKILRRRDHVGAYLEHLGGNNDRLAGHVALGDHHLLSQKHLAGGDLDPEVSARDHDAVRLREDLVKVDQALLVLDLDDDLDVLAVGAEHLTDVAHILAAADKGRKDHVDAVLDTEAEVGLVLLRESGEIDIGLGEVDTLARRKGAVVDSADTNVGALDRKNKKRQNTWEYMINIATISLAGYGSIPSST